jgi:hypothetical protein
MTETALPMHGEAAGTTLPAQATCDACPNLFKRRKRWQRFCSSRCRNDWHQWTRPEAVKEARELVRLALEGCNPVVWNPRARRLLGVK